MTGVKHRRCNRGQHRVLGERTRLIGLNAHLAMSEERFGAELRIE